MDWNGAWIFVKGGLGVLYIHPKGVYTGEYCRSKFQLEIEIRSKVNTK